MRFELARQFDHFVRVVAAGAGQHRDFALGLFQRDLDHAQMLGARERRALARGAAGNQKIDARVDLAADQSPQRLLHQATDRARNGVTSAVPHPVNMYHLLESASIRIASYA